MIQLDLFEQDEISEIRHRVNSIKDSQEKVRKSLFARNGELHKKYDDLLQRMEILEKYLCQG